MGITNSILLFMIRGNEGLSYFNFFIIFKTFQMKQIILFICFCITGMLGYAQPVTTPQKKQTVSKPPTIVDKQAKMPRLTPICYGKVAADGTILSGTNNFTVQKSGEADYGIYWIRCEGISEFSVIIATAQHYEYQCTGNVDPQSYFPTRMTFQTRKLSTSKLSAAAFQFVIYDP